MDQQEARVFRRPSFDPRGRLVARRELTFGVKTYAPTAALPDADELGLDARALRVLYEQGAVDTYPRNTGTLRRPVAVARPAAKGGG